ncbi:MAG: TetR-like C-terminal domain-containing protein [Pseudomonadales bacterium]|jgi:AcrR family transcriptional regulator
MSAGPPGKTSYHHGDLREALLVAAEALLTESGVSGLTLRACARRAGVSHAAPKHHFEDVTALLSEVAARSFDRLTAALKADRGNVADDPEARVVSVFRTYVAFARRYPDHFRLMFRWDAVSAENPVLREAANRTFAEMTSSITAVRGDADVTAETLTERISDPALKDDVLLAWSQIHGYAQLLLEGQFDPLAGAENLDDFVARTVEKAGRRLSQALRAG